jgi:hypothetical protein
MLYQLGNVASNIGRWYEISAMQPAYINPDLQYPEALRGLLSLLFSSFPSRIHEQFSNLLQQETITQHCLLKALLGIAVTKWCLRPTLESKNYLKDLNNERIDEHMDARKLSPLTNNLS